VSRFSSFRADSDLDDLGDDFGDEAEARLDQDSAAEDSAEDFE
jgi:hypothetical protein